MVTVRRKHPAQVACSLRGQSRAHTPKARPQTPRLRPSCRRAPRSRSLVPAHGSAPRRQLFSGQLWGKGGFHRACSCVTETELTGLGTCNGLRGRICSGGWRRQTFGGVICCVQKWKLTQESGVIVKCWTISWSKGQPQSRAGQAFSRTLRDILTLIVARDPAGSPSL